MAEFSASAQIINPIYLQTSELPGKVFANYFLAILKIRPFEKRLMGISNVKSPIWALLQHPKPLQKLDYKVQIL